MQEWTDLYVTTGGAAAALGGLVIVAMSVNVTTIIRYAQLPSRAGAAIGSLVAVVVVSIAALAPQSLPAFGAEVVVVALGAWALHARAGLATAGSGRAQSRPRREAVQVVVIGQVQSLPLVAGGVMLSAGEPAGAYVLFAAVLVIFPLVVLEAWVLLVEILR